MKVSFKIPYGFASHLVNQRQLRNVYSTNKAIKIYSFFVLLKTLTDSGTIKDYNQQLDVICNLTKKSKATCYNYLSQCKGAGLLTITNNSIYLKSWKQIIDAHEIADYNPLYTVLEYDVCNSKQTPEYMIYAAEIAENQARQTKRVIVGIENNLSLAEKLHTAKQTPDQVVQQLQKLQAFTFMNDKSENDYSIIHSINADVQRTARTLRKAYGFKDRRSIKYLKTQLVARGIATIRKRCLESSDRNRVDSKLYYTGYYKDTQSTFWKQPDLIKLKVA